MCTEDTISRVTTDLQGKSQALHSLVAHIEYPLSTHIRHSRCAIHLQFGARNEFWESRVRSHWPIPIETAALAQKATLRCPQSSAKMRLWVA